MIQIQEGAAHEEIKGNALLADGIVKTELSLYFYENSFFLNINVFILIGG